MKYGKKMIDCVTFLKIFLLISEIKIAINTARSCEVTRFNRLYTTVFLVISHPVPDENKYSKFANPFPFTSEYAKHHIDSS